MLVVKLYRHTLIPKRLPPVDVIPDQTTISVHLCKILQLWLYRDNSESVILATAYFFLF